MRMDTETISYVLEGHELQNDVQTMIQVFLANRHYIRTDTVTDAEITVKSEMKEGIASAMLYRRGEKASAWSMEYDEKMLTEKEQKRIIKRTIYELLKAETGIRPQWGLLTGVRPAKLISSLLEEGKTDKECLAFLTEDYLVMPHKAALALKVAKAERKILEDNRPEEISLYIGIPFCPTRCLYCSFTAYPLHQYKNRVDEYLDAMFRELDWLAAYSRGFVMKNIYIGGGTPTSLNEAQLERLLQKVEELFHPDESMEYTVEAGRPDTITREKLRLLKEYGVNRISINPQTMNDKTLRAVGRKHTVEDIRRVFREAREEGHQNINMDLIAGLTGDSLESFCHTVDQVIAMAPENITLHTLSVKRSSRLGQHAKDFYLQEHQRVTDMLSYAGRRFYQEQYRPYYLYRQKNTMENMENVGYCKEGKEGYYNVYIMDETHSIIALGAGGVSKLRRPGGTLLHRIFNYKYPYEYIERFDMVLRRKDEIIAFYRQTE